MNTCSIDFPSDVSEIEAAGFAVLSGAGVQVPRIAEAPVVLECRHYTTLEVSHRRHLCIGSVVHLHARAGIIDAERLRVNLDAYKPIARLFGNPYARLGEKSCSSANPLPNGTQNVLGSWKLTWWRTVETPQKDNSCVP